MPDKKAVIFDFDGTLADSIPIIRSIYTELAAKNSWKTMTDKDYEVLRRGTLKEARRWSGIRFWQLPLVLRSARKLMKIESEKVKLFPGIESLVRDLHAQGHDLYVLSRNSPHTVSRVLERYKLHSHMTILARRKRSFGSKSDAINLIMRKHGYNNAQVWMVGDEVRDIQAANASGVNSIAVNWGIQDMSILGMSKPTRTAFTVKELAKILKS